jgi:glycosyltransferase involved in cell wall biosynthesis
MNDRLAKPEIALMAGDRSHAVDPAPIASLVVFSDDWGRHPSSCQHLVKRLADRCEVLWVNTIGTRTPRFDWATVRRVAEKMRQWTRRKPKLADGLPANPRVMNPWMWPYFGSTASRAINCRLLSRQLDPVIQRLAAPRIAVTTVPLVADLIGRLPVDRWVYYCVDDFGEWPGLDQPTLRATEARLVRQVDSIVAVSETLQKRLANMGRSSELITHGVDLEHWSDATSSRPLPQLEGIERPLVVFWGVIDRRMDVAFVRRLGEQMERGSILLVGPENDPDPRLFAVPRVRRLGAVDYSDLPALARESSVLVMPYADLPVTRAIQPLKLKEYLATGLPTVVRDLPAVRTWADCLDSVATPDEFAATVRRRLAHGVPCEQRQARARLVAEGWTAKAAEFERALFASEATSRAA